MAAYTYTQMMPHELCIGDRVLVDVATVSKTGYGTVVSISRKEHPFGEFLMSLLPLDERDTAPAQLVRFGLWTRVSICRRDS